MSDLSGYLLSDLDHMLSSSEFAVQATYRDGTVNVLFDNAYEGVDIHTAEVESLVPQAICKTADIPDVSHDDILKINGVTYYIKNVQPDIPGPGLTTLILSAED